MIQVILDFAIIYIIFRIRERKSDIDEFFINSFCFAIYAVPRIALFLITLIISVLTLPMWIVLPFYLLFFICPMMILKSIGGFSWKRSISYGAVVLSVVIIDEIIIYLVFQSISA